MMHAIHDSVPIALVSLGPIMACLPACVPVLTPTRCHLILSDQIRSNCLCTRYVDSPGPRLKCLSAWH